jgi:thioredoxin-related protein
MNFKQSVRSFLTIILSAGGLSVMPGIVHAESVSQKKPGTPWFQGSVEEAFAAAKKERRALFLYWGAVWCPPCNYLKAQVFDAPRFAEVMRPAVAVYLDGDSEQAQDWGAKFKAEGYPTIILFDPDGNETMRLDSALNFSEFERVVTAAFAGSARLRDVVTRAVAGKASDSDWSMLTGVYWSAVDEKVYPEAEHVRDRLALFDLVPKTRSSVRARIAAGLLETGLGAAGDDKRSRTQDEVKRRAADLFAAVFQDQDAMFAARELIAYMQQDYLSWLFPDPSPASLALINSWRAAHESLRQRRGGDKISADILMGLAMGDVTLFRLQHADKKDTAVPAELADKVRTAVKNADRESVSEHQRISAIPSAAYYLREIGDFAAARALLDRELKTTQVPWYFQSSYSGVERAAGNEDKALYWAAQARQSAKGRASRVQWIMNEISLVAKAGGINDKDKDMRLLALLTEYYDTALGLADGFSGRNASRMQSLVKILKPLQEKKEFADLTRTYARKCQGSRLKPACEPHFAEFSSGLSL